MRVVVLLALVFHLLAQTVTLRGVITDDSGAVVPGAQVTIVPAKGSPKSVTTNAEGVYQFPGLESTDYDVMVSAPGMALSKAVRIRLKSATESLNLRLKIATVTEQVTVVDAPGSTVTPDPASNANALILKGEDLDALSDDPTALQEDLLALAGPGAGPNGGQIFVDGFSGGQIPSKDSIREIRINQNPFSPEYDKLGFGRIEIFTKPGSDKFRGSLFYNVSHDSWNTRSAYSATKAPFFLNEFGGSLGGPIGKKASFFLDIRRDSVNNGALLNGVTLNPSTLSPEPFANPFEVKQRTFRASPRFDYQLDSRNTLTVRYGYFGISIPGAGIGSFNVPGRGFNSTQYTHSLQASETAVLGSSIVNEIRFQGLWFGYDYDAITKAPAINVSGSFNGGGSNVGNGADKLASYELQEYVSIAKGTHTYRFGGRFRRSSDDSVARQNFNGTFLFNGTIGPQLDANNQPLRDASGQPVLGNISSIEQYRRTLLFAQLGYSAAQTRSLGGGASQFTLTAGVPNLQLAQSDVGLFFGDDWRLKPNLTLSYGLRYETQTNISDHSDFAPRFGVAWAPGAKKDKKPKTVLRFGSGMFYDRFPLQNSITARRYNGTLQPQYVVANPDFFPNIPAPSSFTASLPIVQSVSPSMQAQYIIQSAFSIERQLPRNTTLAITYANSHGLHILRSRNINAPLDATRSLYPFPGQGPIYQMESSGLYNQNQLIVNSSTKLTKKISLNGSYMINKAQSNTDGIGTFPANQYNLAGEYGPAATDIRHRVSLTGSIATLWDLRLSPLLVWQSGMPYNITAGQDLFGSTLFNSRPALVTDSSRPGVISTPYGLLDPNPRPGDTILGRNAGRGPGMIRFNTRISKTIGVGPRRGEAPANTPFAFSGGGAPGGGGNRGVNTGVFSQGGPTGPGNSVVPRRYNLVLSATFENLLNHNNPGPIIGTLTSPFFGRANQPAGARDLGGGGLAESANNRKIELQLRFNF